MATRIARLARSRHGRALGGTVLTAFVAQLALAVGGVLMARALGPTARGHIALFIVMAVIAVHVVGLGMPTAVTFELAARCRTVRAVLDRLTRFVIVQLVVLVGVHAGAMAFVAPGLPRPIALAGWLTVLVGPALLLQQYGQATLLGLREYTRFNIVRLLPSVGLALAIVTITLIGQATLLHVVVAWLAVSWLSMMVTMVVCASRVKADGDPVSATGVRELVRFGVRGLLGSASPAETFQFDQAVVGLALTPLSLGLYAAAVAFTNLPRFIGQSLGQFIYAETAGSPDPTSAKRIVWRYAAWGGALCALVVLPVEVFAGPLVRLLFGPAFGDAAALARILLVGSLFLALRRLLAEGARGMGWPEISSHAESVSWAALCPAILLLLPGLGVTGVAIAMVLSSVASFVYVFAAIRRKTRVRGSAGGSHFGLRSSVAAALALGAASGALTVRVGAATTGTLHVVLITGTVVTCLWPLVARIRTHTFDLFEPLVGGSLALLLLFGIRPAYMLMTGDFTYEHEYDMSGQFTAVAGLGFVASLAFVAGYELATPGRGYRRVTRGAVVPTGLSSEARRRLLQIGIAFSVLGTLLYMVHLIRSGGISETLRTIAAADPSVTTDAFSNSSQYLSFAPVLVACAAVLGAAVVPRPSFVEKLAMAGAAFYPAALFMAIGTRRFIIPALLLPLLVYYIRAGRRPSGRAMAIVLPVAFLVLATIPFARASGARIQAGGAIPIYQQSFERPSAALDRFLGSVDTAMFPALGIELDALRTPSDYSLGRATIGDLMLAPIPHLVVPEKPQSARDELLVRTFGEACGRRSCPDFSIVGTFFQDGWWIGVGLGMFLVGVGLGRLWRRYELAPAEPAAIIAVASATVFTPIIFRAGFNPAASWALMFFVPCWLGLWALGRRRTSSLSSRRLGWDSGLSR